MQIDHAHLAAQVLKLAFSKGLGEDVRWLCLIMYVPEVTIIRMVQFLNEITVDFNIFDAFMEYGQY